MPNMPLLPKQPVVLYMGRELISKEGLELIRDGISEATNLESACMANTILGGSYHVQPVIPEHSGDNLPCPFCGGEVDVSGWRSSNGNSGPECNECGATASNLSDWNKRTAQPVSEPKPVGYFSYGSEHGFDWHKTEKEAIESAEAAIDDYRGDACDGWSEETDSICWGVILQQATKIDERPRTDDDKCDPAIDTVCDYALLPARED